MENEGTPKRNPRGMTRIIILALLAGANNPKSNIIWSKTSPFIHRKRIARRENQNALVYSILESAPKHSLIVKKKGI